MTTGALPSQEGALSAFRDIGASYPGEEWPPKLKGPAGPASLATVGLSGPSGEPLEPEAGRTWELTAGEQRRLELSEARVAACGTRWKTFRRVLTGYGPPVEQRLLVMIPCGLRECPSCAERARRDHRSRVLWRWTTFATLGFSHRHITVEQSWRRVSGWIRALTRWMRKRFSLPIYGEARNEGLEYAWVLEPHKSLYPHVHLTTNLLWIDRHEWMAKWREITGQDVQHLDVKRVHSTDGICYYIAKYVSKARLTPEILAIMFRRRLWASTLKAKKVEHTWTEEQKGEWLRHVDVMDDVVQDFASEGVWKKTKQVEGVMVAWERPAMGLPEIKVEPRAHRKRWAAMVAEMTWRGHG